MVNCTVQERKEDRELVAESCMYTKMAVESDDNVSEIIRVAASSLVLRMREPRAVASLWLCIRRLFLP